MRNPQYRPADCLVLARYWLAVTGSRAWQLRERVAAIGVQVENGDTAAAVRDLPGIITELGALTEKRRGFAQTGEKLTQDLIEVPLPGVSDAIDQLEKALAALTVYRLNIC